MKRTVFAAVLLALSGPHAYALCQDGPPFACRINGQPGTRECSGGHITACIPDNPLPHTPTPHPANGTGSPNYIVLTVIYAPPGTQGGHSSSSVSYGSGSSTGTTTSSTNSFKQSYGVAVTAGGGFLASASVGVGFTYARNTSDTKSLDLKKSTTTTIKSDGPGKDGIDHDHDQIYLWLNPTVNLTVTSTAVSWTFSGTGTADIQFVYVGWLKNPATMPPGVAQALARNGVTPADYPAIMAHDAFASGANVLSGPRFVSLNTTFPYEPPFSATDPVPTTTFNLTNSTTSTTGSTASDDYKVSLTLSGDASFLGLAKVSLKSDDSWDWTNASSSSAATGTTESATATVGGPAFGYTGSTDVAVFYDTVYKTFVFRMVDANTPVGLRGRLLAVNGTPLPFHEVTAVSGGKRFRTLSDAQGNYRFFGAMPGAVRLQSGTIRQDVTRLRSQTPIELRIH